MVMGPGGVENSAVIFTSISGVNRTITIRQPLVTSQVASIWSRRGELGTSRHTARDSGQIERKGGIWIREKWSKR